MNSACEMSSCIRGVHGHRTSGRTCTSDWTVKFNDDTRYENDLISEGMVKVWIHHNSYVKFVSKIKKGVLRKLFGMSYDINVNKRIIRPLVDFNVCPNFVHFLGGGQGCTYDDIVRMLGRYGGPKSKIEDAFVRNVMYMKNGVDIVPSVTNFATVQLTSKMRKLAKSFVYDLIVTNPAMDTKKHKVEKFNEFIIQDSRYLMHSQWHVIFQVVAGCYAMSESGLIHNNMNPSSVTIKRNREQLVIYNYNFKTYVFQSRQTAYISGFKRSQSSHLGFNYNRNKIASIPNLDAIQFLYYVYEKCGKDLKPTILKLITSDKSQQAKLQKMYSDGPTFKLDPVEFAKFNSTSVILDNISQQFHNLSDMKDTRKAKYYACNPDMFHPQTRELLIATRLSPIATLPHSLSKREPVKKKHKERPNYDYDDSIDSYVSEPDDGLQPSQTPPEDWSPQQNQDPLEDWSLQQYQDPPEGWSPQQNQDPLDDWRPQQSQDPLDDWSLQQYQDPPDDWRPQQYQDPPDDWSPQQYQDPPMVQQKAKPEEKPSVNQLKPIMTRDLKNIFGPILGNMVFTTTDVFLELHMSDIAEASYWRKWYKKRIKKKDLQQQQKAAHQLFNTYKSAAHKVMQNRSLPANLRKSIRSWKKQARQTELPQDVKLIWKTKSTVDSSKTFYYSRDMANKTRRISLKVFRSLAKKMPNLVRD
jgi:hypothetical protein